MRSRLDPWRFRTPRLTLRLNIECRAAFSTSNSKARRSRHREKLQTHAAAQCPHTTGSGVRERIGSYALMDLESIRRLLGGVIGRGLSESRARPSLSLSFGMFYCQESPAQSLTLAVIVHNQHASVLRLHSRTQIHFTDAHQDSLESPLEELVHTSRA